MNAQHCGFRIFLLVALLALPFLARAQDARFVNMNASSQLVNPALTGVIPGRLQFSANYRELYTSLPGADGYRSYAAGLEIRRPTGGGNYFGFGAQLQRDDAPTSNFNRSQGLVGASYQQQIAGSNRRGVGQYLSGGAQVGFGQRGFDLNKIWFSNQYFVDNTTREAYLDRTLPNGEPFTGNGSGTYLDVNAGVAWFGEFGDRKGAYAGISAYHLNTPNVSPLPGGTDELNYRLVIHGGGELPIGAGDMSLLPAFRIMDQGPSLDALIGANVRYTQREWREIALRAGLWAQGSNQAGGFGMNAAIFTVGLETERVQFGLSYDISVGELTTVTSGRGGWELSVIYRQPAKFRRKVVCPKF
ncbi:PorP/SprF family type IX secretion system membrane protein [Neolewinella antarctica]|uniref:Type IX secretion system PorP/SprF family membrane protein n=1 Tax=Neolewinella antarctica TaxID=442734 RepID=A0ABX0X843_9BACT|nr:PorP/SprF family type IX secretion system membrane protein [Neolewinella antarctica]NJC25220.1 type IX secretion system PorP/SprF family membrane protein [Neolewinella antarctica]